MIKLIKNKVWISALLIVFFTALCGSYFFYFSQARIDLRRPAIPFEYRQSVAPGTVGSWYAIFLIRPEHCTVNNLEEIFLWYSRQHPDKKETFVLYVYLDRESYQSIFAESAKYAAFCSRSENGNLSYYYIPDLNHTEKKVNATLRGSLPGVESHFFEKLERSNENFRIQATSATLNERISTKGVYYTFWSSLTLYENRHGQHIFSLRLDKTIPIPANQIVFISEKVGYVYMGWLFSATVDGAKSWHQWDAEMEFPDWKCCDPNLIQKVEMTPEGKGTMTLEMSGKLMLLQTADYGQHWMK
jgi:hypothetical protein